MSFPHILLNSESNMLKPEKIQARSQLIPSLGGGGGVFPGDGGRFLGKCYVSTHI